MAALTTLLISRPRHRRAPSTLRVLPEDVAVMASAVDPVDIPKSKSQPVLSGTEHLSIPPDQAQQQDLTPGTTPLSTSPPTPGSSLSRRGSFSSHSQDESDYFPPLERLTIFDLLENISLPSRLERIQSQISLQTERQRLKLSERINSSGLQRAREKVVDEWRRRLPTSDEQLDKYRRRMRDNVDRLNKQWNEQKAVTLREKMSFIGGVMNIFISGYLVGARPEWYHLWYTAQLLYFMPIRFYTYHKKGYHYFLADLCYFVNLLLMLSVWVFPGSKRLLISTFCLAFGNNAVAIAMWRNSLVFHSLDKVTSLFIHIMPCVTLHCLVHLIPSSLQASRFPAIYSIKYSSPTSPQHYTLKDMMLWASVPYAVWQLSYHFLITIRRREKIRAGRPTSFTWLRKSYGSTFIGKFVLRLPDALQEPAFMGIQYSYALATMVPCPVWFWYRWPSAGFLLTVFVWSVWNGATYYIDVFGTRFQRELEQLRRDVGKWQNTPEMGGKTPSVGGSAEGGSAEGEGGAVGEGEGGKRTCSIDRIPLLDERRDGGDGGASGASTAKVADGDLRERKP